MHKNVNTNTIFHNLKELFTYYNSTLYKLRYLETPPFKQEYKMLRNRFNFYFNRINSNII
jgi:hypothetical protein